MQVWILRITRDVARLANNGYALMVPAESGVAARLEETQEKGPA